MQQQAIYEEWYNSPFYHKLYSEENEENAKDLIPGLLQRLDPAPDSKILEIGCGKGNNAKTLASSGFDVTGIDMAPDNIAVAKQSEADNLRFFIHDIRRPFWINYFNYSFSFFNSFGYYNTKRDHDDAIRTIAGSLRPGGVLVMDYLNVHFEEDHLIHNEIKKIDGTDYAIHCWDDETHFYKKIQVKDPSLKEPKEFMIKFSKFSLGDFTDMLSYQGLQVQEVFGNYKLDSYDIKRSPRLIIIAKEKMIIAEDEEKRLYND